MKHRYAILIVILVFLIPASIVHFLGAVQGDWRALNLRDHYTYSVDIRGLSGREAVGTTTVMVPIPATNDGDFVITPSQKDPSLIQNLTYEYILHTPESKRRGPYFANTTEALDDKIIEGVNGYWTTFITKTDDGYMLGFKTNASILDDISFNRLVVVNYVDIFDPIYKNGPVLYPMTNLSEISTISYGDQEMYSPKPTYDSYVYISDNIEEGITNFYIRLEACNDPSKWPLEYRGCSVSYVGTNTAEIPPYLGAALEEPNLNKLGINTNRTGRIIVKAFMDMRFRFKRN